MPISEFYLGPGKVDLQSNEILKGFKIKEKDYKDYKGHYIKFSQRRAMDIATLGCSVLLKEQGGPIDDMRIAFWGSGTNTNSSRRSRSLCQGETS
ncbi:hypothetical protein AZF37_03180 [endosymbiont 'TC1' of Trimyema compressum]|nr:hypothetical protein AZF37_03180 [endosymbiont 'TC1' of Trimyema compressum]